VAGPSVYEALKKINCTIFPIGLLKDENEIVSLFSIIKKHKIDTLITIPSFMDSLLFFQDKNNVKVSLKRVVTSGEFLSDNLRDRILKKINAHSYSTYASSETFIGYKCEYAEGYHYDKEHVAISVKENKLLFTVYDSDLVPIYKYYLGDNGYLDNSQCSCGSKLPRVFLTGRDKNIFNLSGAVTVYPFQIKECLDKTNLKIKECNLTISDSKPGIDKIIFNVGLEKIASEKDLDYLEKELENLSLDFSDVYNQKLVDIEIKQFISEHLGNKMILNVFDEREYEK